MVDQELLDDAPNWSTDQLLRFLELERRVADAQWRHLLLARQRSDDLELEADAISREVQALDRADRRRSRALHRALEGVRKTVLEITIAEHGRRAGYLTTSGVHRCGAECRGAWRGPMPMGPDAAPGFL